MRGMCVIVLVAVLSAPVSALAEVPQHFTLNVQVFELDDPFGFSYQGPVKVELFDAATEGQSLWYETHDNVSIDYGFVSVALGVVNTVKPLADVLLANAGSPLFVEVTLGGTGEKLPERIELTSVPFSLACSQADDALKLEGKTASAFSLAGHEHVEADIADWPSEFTPAAHDHAGVYLPAAGKAVDADTLDGLDGSAYALTANTYLIQESDAKFAKQEETYTKQQCEQMFAAKEQTYTKQEVDVAIAAAVAAAVGPLQEQLSSLQGDAECPGSYQKVNDPAVKATGYYCRKAVGENKHDEVVKVGDFWIDRYEMSLWNAENCTGKQYGVADGDAHAAGFVRNGSDATKDMVACSLKGVGPSRWLTWFQAQRACTLAGKHLCTDAEWQAAAFGTPDPHTIDPGNDSEPCNIWVDSKPSQATWAVQDQTILTGSASGCISHFGAYDMVGNLWEWTADWWGQGPNDADDYQPSPEFHSDGYWNVDNAEYNGSYPGGTPVFPASAMRGGYWPNASGAGVFAMDLGHGPAFWDSYIGARCCRR